MVKKQYALLLILSVFLPACLFCQDVKVTAEVEESLAGRPIKGSITVTHDRNTPVEMETFELGGKSLEVEFLKDVQISQTSDLIISIYNFSIPPQEAGLHALPEVSVTVGNRTYRSIQSSYEVKSPTLLPTTPSKTPSKRGGQPSQIPIVLGLDAIVEGDATLYPGQQMVVGYTFRYNFSIDLSKEDLPLLQAEGFEKVGAKDTQQAKEGDINTLDVRQVIEAVKPGEYKFPPGVIGGRAYRIGRFGQREDAPSESRAESQPVTIHVLPFPEQGKPPSFNGAIGTELEFNAALLSSDTVTVGDKIILLIKISGNGELSTMPMPEVCCQPGFSGFFRLSDLPPVEEIAGAAKTFKVEMRPLSASIKAIPSLEFSYFNPRKKAYETIKSDPIPLKVTPLKGKPTEEQKRVLFEDKAKMTDEKGGDEAISPEAIEIEGVYPMVEADLESRTFGTWWVLLIIPFGIAFIFLQIHMKSYIEKQKGKPKKMNSGDYFREAMQQEPGTSSFFNLLQKAFLLRLVERGDIPSENISPDYLPTTREPGRVRALMREIEERRFAGVGEVAIDQEFMAKIRKLFNEIKGV